MEIRIERAVDDSEIMRRLLEYTQKPRRWADLMELAKELGISHVRLRRILSTLMEEKKIVRTRKGYVSLCRII